MRKHASNQSGLAHSALCAALLAAFASPGHASEAERAMWREYARASLRPAALEGVEPVSVQASPAQSALVAASGRLALSVHASAQSEGLLQRALGFGQALQFESRLPVNGGIGLSSSVLAPSLVTPLGASTQLSLGLTIASQRFATPGFGEASPSAGFAGMYPRSAAQGGAVVEQSFGQGVNFGFEAALGERLLLGLSAQSRVDMDAFKSYRGVFTEPGDFDVPARSGFSLGWRAAELLTVRFGAERVFYSDVTAFTSRALPPRFLALLGDGSSPSFEWRDLNVYSLQAELSDRAGGQWGLKLTSRQQPSPTSTLLDLALRDNYSSAHVAATYRRATGEHSGFSLGASYAPNQSILGVNPFGSRYRDGSQLELELNWNVGF